MRFGHGILVLLLGLVCVSGHAQATVSPIPSGPPSSADTQLQSRMDEISAALAATQKQIEQSQREMQQLKQQLQELRQQMIPSGTISSTVSPNTSIDSAPKSDAAYRDNITMIEEQQQTTEAAVRQHDQTKVESTSKYPVRIAGLVLFNSFLNRGVADNTDLPEFALKSTSTSGNGSFGAGLRQTILGIEGDGPRIANARTSANVSLDFFSGVTYTGYGTSAGVVRMRTARVGFDWTNDFLQVGLVAPLISPRSPDSFATVAEPSMAGAGNLWTWAPELRYTHRFPIQEGNRFQVEFGLWDSPSAGYNSNVLFRTPSPAELAQQPAYETRVSYGTAREQGFQFGLGGYYSRQAYPGYQGYPGTEHLDSWAGTVDWHIPLGQHFEVTGEGYRGRSIAGLGGGVYKDVIAGTDPTTGAAVLHPLNALGGWTQFKSRFNSSLETNFAIGQDDGFARDFHSVIQSPAAGATQLRARNKMVVTNLIFRPRTYIILSPEYRRIWSWPIAGNSSTLDVYTLSVGYQF